MKKLLALFCLFIFLYACSKDADSNKVIAKDKMYNVLIDMHLADASLDYISSYSNADTLLKNAKSKYDYIFSKYSIDSASFSQSLAYYSKNNPKEIVKIYQNVIDSLDRFRDKLAKGKVEFNLPIYSILPDSIYYQITIPFPIDSNLLKAKKQAVKTDSLDVKEVRNSLDTVKVSKNKLRRRLKK